MTSPLRVSGRVVAAAIFLLATVGTASVRAQGPGYWTVLAEMPQASQSTTGTSVGGLLYVAAGYPDEAPLRSYDPATDVWTTLAAPNLPRREPALVGVGTKLYLLGGCLYHDCTYPADAMEVYDTTAPSLGWMSAPSMPRALHAPAAAELDGKLYVVGGAGVNPANLRSNQTYVFDPTAGPHGAWSAVAPLPVPDGAGPAAAAAVGYDHKLYVYGGDWYYSEVRFPGWLWRYDPASDTWALMGQMSLGYADSVVGIINGQLHVAGGSDYRITDRHFVFDFAEKTWVTPAAAVLDIRYWAAGTAIGDTLYVAGGANEAGPQKTLYAWHPSAAPPTPPTITHTIAGTLGNSGWYVSDVNVSWAVTGATSQSDVCTSGAFVTSDTAATSFSCTASNGAGSVSDPVTIARDATPPTVSYTGGGTYTIAQTVNVTCSAADNLSGVASTTCQNVTGPAWSFPLGSTTLSATATDHAGNVGSGSTTFTVTAGFDGLSALVNQFSTNAGVAQGLCAKLTAAQAAAARGQAQTKANNIRAFANQVDAQTGKALTPQQAALLKQLAAGM